MPMRELSRQAAQTIFARRFAFGQHMGQGAGPRYLWPRLQVFQPLLAGGFSLIGDFELIASHGIVAGLSRQNVGDFSPFQRQPAETVISSWQPRAPMAVQLQAARDESR